MPIVKEALFRALAIVATVEDPQLHDGSDKHQNYLDGVETMAGIYVEVGARGEVVSPTVDPLLLAAIGYEESRHRPKSPDGDCRFVDPRPSQRCDAFGPMQINKSSPGVLANIDSRWKGETVESLRDPRRNVEAAYFLLRYWKDQCKHGVAPTLGEWSAGKCLGKRPIPMGARRCALAQGLGEALGVPVTECDGAQPDAHTRRLLAALKRAAGPAVAPVAAPAAQAVEPKPKKKETAK